MLPFFQSLIGDVDNAMRTFLNYYTVWKQFGGLPEFYNIPQGYTVDKREGYPLRPGKEKWNKKEHRVLLLLWWWGQTLAVTALQKLLLSFAVA